MARNDYGVGPAAAARDPQVFEAFYRRHVSARTGPDRPCPALTLPCLVLPCLALSKRWLPRSHHTRAQPAVADRRVDNPGESRPGRACPAPRRPAAALRWASESLAIRTPAGRRTGPRPSACPPHSRPAEPLTPHRTRSSQGTHGTRTSRSSAAGTAALSTFATTLVRPIHRSVAVGLAGRVARHRRTPRGVRPLVVRLHGGVP